MVLWKSIVLGIVQGLTEFLPVSSSGHLVVFSGLLKADSTLAFDVALHFGSLIALVIFFWGDIVGLFRGFLATFRRSRSHEEARKRNMFWLIVAAIIPSGVIGVMFSATIEKAFASLYVVAAMFLVTAALLFLQRFSSTARTIREVGWKDALAIGIGQVFALLPGLSRSGTTMSVGVYRGLKQEDAAHFSFLMAIPTIAGAAIFKLKDFLQAGMSSSALTEIGIGVVVSVLTSLVAIGLLLKVARKGKMQWFALYCVTAAVFTFAAHYFGLI
ncbi:undecaprenyl-diphosphate phosphatase [Candidatus Cryosericum septentrionale]|jgi:undecaprenyl-diphosphatase|uniref:Undecaprenyl-diphosphatase n=1 Tax=Candidatus Cryosericum septentrionale TaxID=2290913 RepID=A0A398DL10_9BACT|nr:undecaprenyl-diphosphate phosphatase [Candidatus Cryosericum septentrionale]RIE16242.1 undecaprenyl-diphosphate phosphatase [Candidatus Cryosericum septentrionale]